MGRWSLALLAVIAAGCGLTGKESIEVKGALSGGDTKTPATATPTATPTPNDGTSGAVELFPFALLTIVEGSESKTCMAGLYGDVLVTAGHCLGRLAQQACSDGTLKVRWFAMEGGVPTKPASAASCSSFVVASTTDSKNDFALIRLAPNSTKPTFSLSFAQQDATEGTVLIFGPPKTGGAIRSGRGRILAFQDALIAHNANHEGGASGSPMFDWSNLNTDEKDRVSINTALQRGVMGMHIGIVSSLISAVPASRLKTWVEGNTADPSNK
jgi:hypothetical protein